MIFAGAEGSGAIRAPSMDGPVAAPSPATPSASPPASPATPSLKIKFISIAGSGSHSREHRPKSSVTTAMVTPVDAAEDRLSPSSATTRSSPSSSMEVQLLPIELFSFGYASGAAPKNCAKVVNCSHLAKATNCTPSAAASSSSATGSPGSPSSPGSPGPQIEELCSFLVYELQALAVGRSPVLRAYDSPISSPLLSPLPMSLLLPDPPHAAATSDGSDVDELRLPSPLHFASSGSTTDAATVPPPAAASPTPSASTRAKEPPPPGSLFAASASAPPPSSPLLPHDASSSLPPAPDAAASPSSAATKDSPADSPPPLLGSLMAASTEPQPAPSEPSAAGSVATPPRPSRRTFSVSPPRSPSASPCASATAPKQGVPSPSGRPPTKLRVGIGCKDGLSVSVAIASYLARQLTERGLVASARHRELERLAKRAAKAASEQLNGGLSLGAGAGPGAASSVSAASVAEAEGAMCDSQ